jgi:hypothetical protein
LARIRSVKPEARSSRTVTSWPRDVRLFFMLLWGYLDDKGRGIDSPKAIAGDCFPRDDDIDAATIDKWLDLMTEGRNGKPGPICRYSVDGEDYIHCVNWQEHQRINRPTPSRLPACQLHEPLTESLNEPGDGTSLPGAAEQQSSRAVEQQQSVREPRTEPPRTPPKPPAGHKQAIRILVDATACTPELASEVALAINRERNPRNLAGLMRTLVDADELGEWFAKVEAAQRKTADAAAIAQARASPPCPHGVPGGLELHPRTNLPMCPLCRKGTPT